MKAWITAVLLAAGLWACNNEAAPDETDTDMTRVDDSGSTPGANTAVNDTLTMDAGAGVDSAALDTLNRNNTQ
jgi:hypothetical protein